ncbi:hypothetical protein F4779DRAFT_21894 [Xylariaceae sp. FL0662B]|nr:hypothetical protein F4779DRAFT_21894 [Xylariaceae sp. FL0662B]
MVIWDDLPLPNRVLWGFFACLLRMCIAMAWPDRGVEGAPFANEQFPENWKDIPMTQLAHCDMHQDNILLGDLYPPGDEHNLIPILKLIDFSEAKIIPDPTRLGLGVKRNIYDIGRIMRMLITCDRTADPEPKKVVVPYNLATKEVLSASASIDKPEYPNLDDDLRGLVMRCTAVDIEDRPTLPELANTIQWNLRTKDFEHYMTKKFPRGRYERDDRIQDLIHDLVFYPPDE